MSADREMLEDAAKAAGVALYWSDDDPECDWVQGTYPRIPDYKVLEKWTWKVWNPFTDDGDALRLAVTCGLVVDCSRPSAGEPFKRHAIWLDETMSNAELTRRAIVRAAAEIGRSMK